MPIVTASSPTIVGGLDGVSGSITTAITNGKSGQGQLYGWYIFNGSNATAYLQLFDVLQGSASGITLGTTVPRWSFGIPTGAAANTLGRFGLQFYNGIYFAFTTTRTGSSAPSATVDYNLFIK